MEANLLKKLSSFPNMTLGLNIVVLGRISLILFSASSFVFAYFEKDISMPRAEIWMNFSIF